MGRFQNINVKDYGAVGDGSTVDTTALQAAMDVAIAADAELFFPAGTYACTDWSLYTFDSGTLRMRGDGATLVHSGAASSFVQLDDGCDGIEMRNLKLQSFYSGVRTEQADWSNNLDRFIIDGCTFTSMTYGTYFADDGAGGISVANADRVQITNNELSTLTAAGIHFQAEQADTVIIRDNTVDTVTSSSLAYGIYVKTTKDDGSNYNEQDSLLVSGNVVRNISSTDDTETYNVIGIVVQGYGARVTDNRVEEVNHASDDDCEGIYVKASNGVVANNTLYNAGKTQGAIALKGTPFAVAGDGSHKGYGIRCANNTIRADDPDTVDRRGIYAGAGDKMVISGNFIEGVREGISFDSTYGNDVIITDNQFVRLEIPSGTGGGILLRGADRVIIADNIFDGPIDGTGTWYGIWTTSGTHSNLIIRNNIFSNADSDTSSTRGIQLSTGNIAGLQVVGNVFEDFGRAIVSGAGITVTQYEIWRDNQLISCGGSPSTDIQHTQAANVIWEGNSEDGVALGDSSKLQTATDGDTTPSVGSLQSGGVLKTANTNPTTIDKFDGGYEGQIFYLYVADANTTIDHNNAGGSGPIMLISGGDEACGNGDVFCFMRTGTSWREVTCTATT